MMKKKRTKKRIKKKALGVDKLEILMMEREKRLKKAIIDAVSQGVESIRVYNESIKSEIRAILR